MFWRSTCTHYTDNYIPWPYCQLLRNSEQESWPVETCCRKVALWSEGFSLAINSKEDPFLSVSSKLCTICGYGKRHQWFERFFRHYKQIFHVVSGKIEFAFNFASKLMMEFSHEFISLSFLDWRKTTQRRAILLEKFANRSRKQGPHGCWSICWSCFQVVTAALLRVVLGVWLSRLFHVFNTLNSMYVSQKARDQGLWTTSIMRFYTTSSRWLYKQCVRSLCLSEIDFPSTQNLNRFTVSFGFWIH